MNGERLLIPNCYICAFFKNRYVQGNNPVVFEDLSYCILDESKKVLQREYRYEAKDCCKVSMARIMEVDPDFKNVETLEEARELFQMKYPK